MAPSARRAKKAVIQKSQEEIKSRKNETKENNIVCKSGTSKTETKGKDICTIIKEKPRKSVVRWQNKNVLHQIYQYQAGCCTTNDVKQALIKPFQEKLSTFRILRTASPFDRRVTSMEWHPTKPTTMCVASKSGDFILWDYEKLEHSHFVKGLGKGGNIMALKFDLDSPDHIYTASADGTVLRQDFEGRSRLEFLNNYDDWSFWYCGMDVNFKSNIVVAGDSIGRVTLLTRRDAEQVWNLRLHKNKVTHCEFNPVCDWLLATTSTDKTVKLWDVRMIKDKNSFVHKLEHEKPVNSAYFSREGSRLLTTDQQNDIRIYNGPYWPNSFKTIKHPHRFYQHLTPIRASWHPIHDVIVIGRYPDSSFPGYREGECRTIDIIDANDGKTICQLLDPSASGVITLNMFSAKTDTLVSAMGYHVLVWTADDDAFQRRQKIMDKLRANSTRVGGPPPTGRRRRGRGDRRDDDDDDDEISSLKKKIKKTPSKTKEDKENLKVKLKVKKK